MRYANSLVPRALLGNADPEAPLPAGGAYIRALERVHAASVFRAVGSGWEVWQGAKQSFVVDTPKEDLGSERKEGLGDNWQLPIA